MQTTSYKLSKKLQKLGVKQESYFYWQLDKEQQALITAKEMNISYTDTLIKNEIFSAFTLDEILEMLPSILYGIYSEEIIKHAHFDLSLIKGSSGYQFLYINKNFILEEFTNPNPAEAAGQLLAWCIENGYVKP